MFPRSVGESAKYVGHGVVGWGESFLSYRMSFVVPILEVLQALPVATRHLVGDAACA